jgi:hypothetical protein
MSPSDFPASLLKRRAIVYVRQSSADQVQTNLESQRRQYELVEKARLLGFRDAAGQAASFDGARRGRTDEALSTGLFVKAGKETHELFRLRLVFPYWKHGRERARGAACGPRLGEAAAGVSAGEDSRGHQARRARPGTRARARGRRAVPAAGA